MNDKMKAKCYRLDYNKLGLSTLCVEKDKEIERLKEEYMILQNTSDEVEEEKDREIERLNNIIKEVREYILQHCEIIRFENENVDKVGKVEGIPLLEILDKEEQ